MNRSLLPWALVSLLDVCCLSAAAQTARIEIRTQAEFDRLGATIDAAIQQKNKEIDVHLQPGTYYFQEGHLSFSKKYYDGVSLQIRGEGSVLTAAGSESPRVRKKKKSVAWPISFRPDVSYLLAGKLLSFSAPAQVAQSRVEVVDPKSKLCRIQIAERLSDAAVQGAYIWISQWFKGNSYPISRVEGTSVYFVAEDLHETERGISIDSDWGYASMLPRYRLINAGDKCYLRKGQAHPGKKGSVHACEATTFLSIRGSHLKSLSLEGLCFSGNARNLQDRSKDALIDLYCSKIGESDIRNCRFRYIQSDCIKIVQVEHVWISDNDFSQCFRGCVFSDVATLDTRVEKNRIAETGLCGDNVTAIVCKGENFLIQGNDICNFGYGGIASGVHYTAQKSALVSGEILNNRLYYTESYCQAAPLELLMDSGAIYFTTQNDWVRVHDNTILNINGPKDNRGIFLDDGASNVHVYRNTVRGTRNSYSIDSRRVASIESRSDSKIKKVNVGNQIYDNTVDGRIRFEQR